MNGIELSRAFYEQFGKAMLREKFPHLKDKIAVGIAGSGSDCYGYDDDISRDHDYGRGFAFSCRAKTSYRAATNFCWSAPITRCRRNL